MSAPAHRSADARTVLSAAAAAGERWLRTILDLEQHSAQDLATSLTESPLKPFWISQAHSILFYTFTKTTCLAGRAKGHGFLVTRLPTTHKTLIKFSAPLFLEISFSSFGLSLGRTNTCSFVACMGKQFQEQLLLKGRRSLRGLDAALLCGSSLQDRADFLTLNCADGMPDTVGVSSVTGGIFDLSFAGGSLRVDAAKNAAAYGDVKPSQILNGAVAPPPELQPLYAELSLIVHQAETERPSAAPSRTSASLERFSTGTDPDQALVLNDGKVLWTDDMARPRGNPAPLARHSV